jgi:hypothetical protein
MLHMLYIWVCNKVKLFLTELIMEPFHEDIWSSGVRTPNILFIGTRWVNGQLHDPAAFPSEKRHRCPFDARASGLHNRSSHFGIRKISWPVENRTPIPLSSNLAPYVYVWWEGTTVCTYVWCRFLGLLLSTVDVAGCRQMEAFHAIKLHARGYDKRDILCMNINEY